MSAALHDLAALGTAALSGLLPWLSGAIQYAHAKTLATLRRWRYSLRVPKKEGNGFGDLNTPKRTNGAMPFFYVRMLSSALMGGGGGEAFGLAGFLWCAGSPTLSFAAHPFGDGSGLTAHQGAHHMANHAGSTATPTPTQFDVIKRLAGQADTLGAYLSIIDVLEPAHQSAALARCVNMAEELASDVAAIAGGTQ
ncbi:MAG: hypothetical protein V4805_17630 [Pseudomonadota bacterium]